MMEKEDKYCYYFELHHLNIFLYILYFHLFMKYFISNRTESYMPSLYSRLYYLYNGVKLYLFPIDVSLNANDSVLLVIDMVEAYRPLFSKSMIDEINKNIDLAKEHEIPIVYTRWVRVADSDEMVYDVVDSKRFWSFYIPEKTDIIEEIKCKMEDYDVIIKTIFPNTFACGKRLKDVIGDRKNLIICGTWTESCIKHTADAAVELNIKPYILKHGCSGHWPFSSWSMIVQGMLQSEIVKSVEYFYLN